MSEGRFLRQNWRVRDSSESASEVLEAERSSNGLIKWVATLIAKCVSSVTLWLESAHQLVPLSLLQFMSSVRMVGIGIRMAGGFKTFTDDVKAAAPQIEPTLEAALRKYDVHEDIITAFRCNCIKSQAVFIALDRTVEALQRHSRKRLGWMQGFDHKRELAQLIAAWEESKIQSETKNKVDAVALAHGEPTSLSSASRLGEHHERFLR